MENVGCCHYALRVLSRMVDSLEDEQEKWDIIDQVYAKLCNQPNSDYNQLWLQNITYQKDKKKGTSPYNIRLCKVVMGENVELWNNSWLKKDLIKNYKQALFAMKSLKKSPRSLHSEKRVHILKRQKILLKYHTLQNIKIKTYI